MGTVVVLNRLALKETKPDRVAGRCRAVEEGSEVHGRAHKLHAFPKCATRVRVHRPHQDTARITLNLHMECV